MPYNPRHAIRKRLIARLPALGWGEVHEQLVQLLGYDVPGMRVATDFYRAVFGRRPRGPAGDAAGSPQPLEPKEALAELLGIDFHSAVLETKLAPGRCYTCYVVSSGPGRPERIGGFLTRVGVPSDHLGIDPQRRQAVRVVVVKPLEALQSRAAGVVDTWTSPDSPFLAAGGGVQYRVPPDALSRGALRIVHHGALG